MDALKEAKGILERDAEMQAARLFCNEDMVVAYLHASALAAVAQAEQLKRIADALVTPDNHPELDSQLDEMERQAAREAAL